MLTVLKDKLDGCGGHSCSSKDEDLIRLVMLCALPFFKILSMIYFGECPVCCFRECLIDFYSKSWKRKADQVAKCGALHSPSGSGSIDASVSRSASPRL